MIAAAPPFWVYLSIPLIAGFPKIRQGSYFPSFLQPRKRSEQALVSVVEQAYVCGVSTRRVEGV